MSNTPDLDLNLETLFQPAWAQGKTEANRYEKFTGMEGVRPERHGGDRPGGRGPRRDGPGGGAGGPGGGARRGFGGGDRGPRAGGPGAGRGGDRRDSGGRGDRRGGARPDFERREVPTPAPLPALNVTFVPEEKGVEMLARQIKMTGRAYPLFSIALLILEKAERYSVQLTSKKKADGTPEQIFVCALDDTAWTNEEEAVAYALKTHFATFYQAERTATEPPKGTYTFVAQCGMSGVILGPPNYHDYQNQLLKLHAEKFSRMPFDMFKARVKIVKDEAVVKQWIEEQSFKTEYQCLNVPEPLKLASLEEVGQHFRATHKDAIIKAVETLTLAGPASRALKAAGLQRLIREEWERQRHFPLPIATRLSQQFAHYGLQFFKVNKTVTHVSVARPQFLDVENSPVSENIRRIVEFINQNTKCTRKKLVEALAPTPRTVPVAAPVAVPPAAPAGETPAPIAGETAPAQPAEPAKPAAPEVTAEQTAIIGDLHWLIHQGHVLEFANGHMETAKKPAPRPVKEPKPAAAKPAPAGTVPTEAAAEVPAETEIEVTVPAEASGESAAETAPAPVETPAAAVLEAAAPVVETAPATPA